MKIKINHSEEKTTATGKTYKRVNVTDEKGMTVDASIWPDNPEYSKAIDGGEVEGLLTQKGSYWNLVAGNLGVRPASMNRTTQMKEMVAQKQAGIEKSQERKDESIRISSTMRDAVLLAIAKMDTLQSKIGFDLEGSILYFRQWLWNHWEDPSQYPPF